MEYLKISYDKIDKNVLEKQDSALKENNMINFDLIVAIGGVLLRD